MTEQDITEIALNTIKTELSDKLESINFDSWLKLVNITCEAVDKRTELTGSQKKEVSIDVLKHFSTVVGFDDKLVKMIIDNASSLIDEVILLTKGVYAINQHVKKTDCFKKWTSCFLKNPKNDKKNKNKKTKTEEVKSSEPVVTEETDEIRDEPNKL